MLGRPEANSGFGRRWGLWAGKYRILREFGGRIRAEKWRSGAKRVSARPTRGADQRRDGARRGGDRDAGLRPAPERAEHRAQVVADDARERERAGDDDELVAVAARGEDVRIAGRVELGA